MAPSAIVLAIALGVALRLDDPLSSSVVPAEDPYTHMALVREHLRDGSVDPLYEGRDLYPPGLHGFLAAVWVYAGTDLYDIVRMGPVAFGAIGLLGVALLLWRHEGPMASVVGVLALAVMPEAIFRTTMMSPTALDLALLPFFMFALLEVMAGRIAWTGAAAPMAAFLVLAHPWIYAILGAAGVAYVLFAAALPWPRGHAPRVSGAGVFAAAAILGFGTIGAAFVAQTGGDGVLSDLVGFVTAERTLAGALALALLVGVGVLARPRAGDAERPTPRAARALRPATSAALGALVVLVTVAAVRAGMPEFVDLPRMFGWPILAMAAVTFLALPYLGGHGAWAGGALVAVTYPFVVLNPLHSPYWSHRTAVFLGFGLALLVGVAAPQLARAACRVWSAAQRGARAGAGAPPDAGLGTWARGAVAATSVSMVVVATIGGFVVAATPPAYDDGWYRLFHECELDGLRAISDAADAEPATIVVSGDWRATLVLAALSTNASRFWTWLEFFESASSDAREEFLAWTGREGRPVLVVTDVYLPLESPDADPSFLRSSPWEEVGRWCTGMGKPEPRVVAYAAEGRAG